ncbi:MAG: hypothetical protein JW795_03545 [Chitinivibrionales bacterium]|nr:hypothetical protein [Chitinivibrionales bacterium]
MRKPLKHALAYLSASIFFAYTAASAVDYADPDRVIDVDRDQQTAARAFSLMAAPSVAPAAVTLPADGKTGVTVVHSVKKIGTTTFTKSWTYNGPMVNQIVMKTIDTGALVSSGQIKKYGGNDYLGWYTVKKNYMGQPGYHYNYNTKSNDSIIVGNFTLTDISSSVSANYYPTIGWTATGFTAGKIGSSAMAYYCSKAPAPLNFNNIMVPQLSNIIAIDVDENGKPWVVVSNGDLYKLETVNGVVSWKKKLTASINVKAVDVAAGAGKVYFTAKNSVDQTYTLYVLTGVNAYQQAKTIFGDVIHAKRVDVTAYQYNPGKSDVWYVSAAPSVDGELYLFDTYWSIRMDDTFSGKTVDVGALADYLQ